MRNQGHPFYRQPQNCQKERETCRFISWVPGLERIPVAGSGTNRRYCLPASRPATWMNIPEISYFVLLKSTMVSESLFPTTGISWTRCAGHACTWKAEGYPPAGAAIPPCRPRAGRIRERLVKRKALMEQKTRKLKAEALKTPGSDLYPAGI